MLIMLIVESILTILLRWTREAICPLALTREVTCPRALTKEAMHLLVLAK